MAGKTKTAKTTKATKSVKRQFKVTVVVPPDVKIKEMVGVIKSLLTGGLDSSTYELTDETVSVSAVPLPKKDKK